MKHPLKHRCTLGLVVAITLLLVPRATAQNSVVLRGCSIETMDQAGRIEQGQILIVDGIIREVGETVNVPDNARIIDLNGRTVMPGFVDPYFVVNFNLGAEPAGEEERVVVFGGRTFRIPSGRGRQAPVSFVRVADVFDARPGSWDMALRSGITTVNIVTSGYGQSVVGNPLPKDMFDQTFEVKIPAKDEKAEESKAGEGETKPAAEKTETKALAEPAIHPIVRKSAGMLYTTVTNDTASLKTVRDGLRDPNAERPAAEGRPEASSRGRGGFAGRGGRERGGPPSGGPPATGGPPTTASAADGSEAKPSADPSVELWKSVRAGEQPLVVNTNNSAGLLYLLQEHDKAKTARLAVVGSGSDWFQTLDKLADRKLTVVLPPRWDTHPFSHDRINVPRILANAKIDFVFSLSAGQSDYLAMQHNPLFPVSMLVKSGLPRLRALEALTIGPAKLLGIDQEAGSIAVGKRADLTVFDADPLEATAAVEQVWIAGKKVYNTNQ